MKAKRHFLFLFALACGLPLLAPRVEAAGFPDRPIHLVVGYAPGGAGDLMGRLVATALTEKLGQNVLVDNRPGADTSIGADYVAHAAPDGYTLFLYGQPLVFPLRNKVNFDPVKSFTPVILLGEQASLLVVNPSLPVKSLQELVALAKSKPGQLNYGSAGPTTPNATIVKMIMEHTGIDMVNVSYTGEGPMTVALLGNEVQTEFLTVSTILPQVRAGKARAIAVSTNVRSPQVPDVPTVAESVNYPEFDFALWYGIVGPAGMPPAILDKLHGALAEALTSSSSNLPKELSDHGLQVLGGSPADFSRKITQQIALWASVAK